jgi:uncharacterized radical SAM protein YgiQ
MPSSLRQPDFPPMSRGEMAALGWDECDVIVVTGDAYVDHPAFGSAVIARVLLDAGYRVGVIAQPDWRRVEPFRVLGRPRLFFGITAGNVDSMVANYSPRHQQRHQDDYSPGGRAGLRPNRAVTVYANRCREAYRDAALVIGGIEASLRRLAHYDYWDDRVRSSLLTDTRADVLVYGMGERAVVEIARRLAAGDGLEGVPGTAVISRDPVPADALVLASLATVRDDPVRFNEAFRAWYRESDQPGGRVVAQPHADRTIVQYPPPAPMTEDELDHVYDLPYARASHPAYREPVPALATVRFSITSHRGCVGSCSFCSLRAHQGRIIQWRSADSIVRETARITRVDGFRGHITDIGGPTVNMYGATCAKMRRGMVCADRECTWPETCPNLRLGLDRQMAMLDAVSRVPGVKRVTVGTGLRYDLLRDRAGLAYLERLCGRHVSGQLRVAPEHIVPGVLRVMRKAGPDSYRRFRERFRAINERLALKQYLIPYFISGHPGATVDDAVELAEYLVCEERLLIRQVQQFTPLPMTPSAAAWHTGLDPFSAKPLHIAREAAEQRLQRSLLQLQTPVNFAYAERELRRMGRDDLVLRIRRLMPLLGHDRQSPKSEESGPQVARARRPASRSGNPREGRRERPDRKGERVGDYRPRRPGGGRDGRRGGESVGSRPAIPNRTSPRRGSRSGSDEWDTRPRRPGDAWPGGGSKRRRDDERGKPVGRGPGDTRRHPRPRP